MKCTQTSAGPDVFAAAEWLCEEGKPGLQSQAATRHFCTDTPARGSVITKVTVANSCELKHVHGNSFPSRSVRSVHAACLIINKGAIVLPLCSTVLNVKCTFQQALRLEAGTSGQACAGGGPGGGKGGGTYLVHGGHAVSCSLVCEVQGASDDCDLIMRQVPSEPLLQAMSINQRLQLCPPKQGLQKTSLPALANYKGNA